MDASVRFLIRFIFHVYLLSPHAVLLPGIKLAMQLRSGRRLVSPPPAPRGDLRRVRPRRIQEDGDAGEDRISSLPDELLLDVLRRLGCAREAARTSVLSHRWSVLWTELRELSIAAVAADAVSPSIDAVETALGRVRPCINSLKLRVLVLRDVRNPTGAQISSLLRAADRLAPAKLILSLCKNNYYHPMDDPFELPCFGRATSIDLFVVGHDFTLAPAPGEFACLEQLNLTLDCSVVDLGVLLSRCPRLRTFRMVVRIPRWINTIAVESKSLEELTAVICTNSPADVVIVAPELKKLGLVFLLSGTVFGTVSRAAPKLEQFLLSYTCQHPRVGLGDKWRLDKLTQWSDRNGSRSRVRVHVLSLTILNNSGHTPAERSFAQEVARLPVNHFSVLDLSIRTSGHVFAPLLLHLLLIRTSIQSLKLVLITNYVSECSENCDCDQDGNWRNQEISLPDLEDVEIQGFSAADHEVDFLQLVFRSAPILKRMNVQLSDEVSPCDGGCQKLHSIFESNASVKCNVYDKSGDMISFA
ncbi:hypothetical protein EJB05_52623, partial [Eragrostis curvula]